MPAFAGMTVWYRHDGWYRERGLSPSPQSSPVEGEEGRRSLPLVSPANAGVYPPSPPDARFRGHDGVVQAGMTRRGRKEGEGPGWPLSLWLRSAGARRPPLSQESMRGPFFGRRRGGAGRRRVSSRRPRGRAPAAASPGPPRRPLPAGASCRWSPRTGRTR